MNAQTMHRTRLKSDTLSALGRRIDRQRESLFVGVPPFRYKGIRPLPSLHKFCLFWHPLPLSLDVFLGVQYTRKFYTLQLVTIATVMKHLSVVVPTVPALERLGFTANLHLFSKHNEGEMCHDKEHLPICFTHFETVVLTQTS